MGSQIAVLDTPALNPLAIMPVYELAQLSARHAALVDFYKHHMIKDVDYGSIPGSDRPALLKPGAEKLCSLFGLAPHPEVVEKVEDWTGKDHEGVPFFYYWYRIALHHSNSFVGAADGSSNSHETKHHWRWLKDVDLPNGADKAKFVTKRSFISELDFAIRQKKTDGQYGRPLEYWARFEQAITDKTARFEDVPPKTPEGRGMRRVIIEAVLYRVPNDNAADLVNTLQKMAYKRALVAVVLIATAASELFTQDIEDAIPEDISLSAAAQFGDFDSGRPVPPETYTAEDAVAAKSSGRSPGRQAIHDIGETLRGLPKPIKDAWQRYCVTAYEQTDIRRLTDDNALDLKEFWDRRDNGAAGPDDQFAPAPGEEQRKAA